MTDCYTVTLLPYYLRTTYILLLTSLRLKNDLQYILLALGNSVTREQRLFCQCFLSFSVSEGVNTGVSIEKWPEPQHSGLFY